MGLSEVLAQEAAGNPGIGFEACFLIF